MNIDVAISDTNSKFSKVDVGSDAASILCTDTDDDTEDSGMECLLLEFLPRDLLTQSILTSYLDGNSLANFWCATMSKTEMVRRPNSPKSVLSPPQSPSMVGEILRIIRRRRALLTEEGNFDFHSDQRYCLRRQVFRAFEEAIATPSPSDEAASDREHRGEHKSNSDILFNLECFLRFSRRIFGTLSAMDYCERVPCNLIWCGFLRIREGGIANDSEPIKVALVVHPRRWSMKEIRLWRNATTWSPSSGAGALEEGQPTVKATVIPHNFLPVGPNRGRLVGLTEYDRIALRVVSDRLNRSELVGRFSCMSASVSAKDVASNAEDGAVADISDRNAGRNHSGQFTVKLMGFAQAQRKLNTVFRRGYEPGGIPLSDEKEGMVLRPASSDIASTDGDDLGVDHDRNSLLCCWNHEFLWEDSRSFRMETSYALRDTMKEYDKLMG